MAILATNLHGVGDLAVNQAVTVAVLGEMAVGTLQALFGVNVHHMDRFARVGADRHELGFACLAEFLGIVVGHNLAFGVEEITLTVTFQDRPEIPAMAMVIGKLRILVALVEVVYVAQEVEVCPFTADGCGFWVAIKNFSRKFCCGVALLFGPHARRVGFIIPHRVAEVRIQKDIGLVHVAIHAL